MDTDTANNRFLNIISTWVYEGFDELGKTLREHNKVASILERAVQNSKKKKKNKVLDWWSMQAWAIQQIDDTSVHLY